MRKLAAIGALAAGVLGIGTGAVAATTDTLVGGSLANNVNTCFQVLNLLTGDDCSYAANRYPKSTWNNWQGPVFASGFYPVGTAADENLDYVISPGDGKLSVPLSGSVTIDDNGTPADGTDDTISATFNFGAAVHYVGTGQNNDSAIERWSAFNHVMAPTPVNFATAQPGGGYEYIIGVRGWPTPRPGPLGGTGSNAGKSFPSEFAKNFSPTDLSLLWETTGATALPVAQRVGIERSEGYGDVGDGSNLQPNIGAQTSAVFVDYQCADDLFNPTTTDPDFDCGDTATLLGAGQLDFRNENNTRVAGTGSYLPANPGGDPPGDCTDGIDNDLDTFVDADDPDCALLTGPNSAGLRRPITPPGFDNVVLRLVTDDTNRVTEAQAYWTREWNITSGNAIGNDPPAGPPGQRWKTNNSWVGGLFTFKGCSPTGPVAVDDILSVVEGSSNAQLLVTSNDSLSCAEPNTLSVPNGGVTAQGGQATVSGTVIVYTAPPGFYDGPDSFTYTLTDGNTDTSTATVNLTITKKVPTATNQSGSSDGGAPVSRTVITNANLGSGTIAEHSINPGAGQLGSCSGNGATLTFTPTPGGGNGTGGCSFTISDADGDASNTAQFVVDVRNNGGSTGGGGGGPQLPGGGSSLDGLTLAALLAGLPLLSRRRRRQG